MFWLLLVPGCTEQPNPPDDRIDTAGTVPTLETGSADTDSPTTETGTSDTDSGDSGQDTAPVDVDGDGWSPPDDCDDTSALTYPGARELCDGLDNDCDGVDDTLGHWPLDEGGGETAVDAGPLGLDGVITSGTWTADGVLGMALLFDGAGTFITLDHSELAPMAGLTLSAWVRPDGLHATSWDSVISRGAKGTSELGCCQDSYYLGYYLKGLSFYTDTDLEQSPLLAPGPYGDHVGSWNHLVSTWDPASGQRVIYVDGVVAAEDSDGPPTAFYDGTPTRIGADTNNGSFTLPFHGAIDEIKIFGCPISAEAAALDHSTGWPFQSDI